MGLKIMTAELGLLVHLILSLLYQAAAHERDKTIALLGSSQCPAATEKSKAATADLL